MYQNQKLFVIFFLLLANQAAAVIIQPSNIISNQNYSNFPQKIQTKSDQIIEYQNFIDCQNFINQKSLKSSLKNETNKKIAVSQDSTAAGPFVLATDEFFTSKSGSSVKGATNDYAFGSDPTSHTLSSNIISGSSKFGKGATNYFSVGSNPINPCFSTGTKTVPTKLFATIQKSSTLGSQPVQKLPNQKTFEKIK